MSNAFIQSDDSVQDAEKCLLQWAIIIHTAVSLLQIIKTAFVWIVGVLLVIHETIPIGSLIVAIQLDSEISGPIDTLAVLHHQRNEISPILNKYTKWVLSNQEESMHLQVAPPFEELSVFQVSYSIDNTQILRDIDFKLVVGDKCIILGKSGCGKSTILRILSQIGDLNYTGQIKFNCTDVKCLKLESYYSQICTVFQNAYLFQMSIRENICMGRQISEEEYQSVIAKLELKYLIERYQDSEITPEIIENLSGGEKQRIALARAMVGKPSVYLLDEVTSGLDSQTAYSIEKVLLDEAATLIHVCHKPSEKLFSQYNKKYELRDGRLKPLDLFEHTV